MGFNEESIWSGASLRPWQILHAKLAEMDMSGNFEVDVWQFVDEAMKSTTTASRLQEEDLYMPRKEELIWQQQHSAGWGSVMMEEEEEEEEEQVISTTMASTSFYELFTATEAEEEEYENVDVGARTYNYHPYSANSAASLDTETPSNIIVGVEELQQAHEGDVYAGAASSCCNNRGELEEEEILCVVCLETLLPNILLITRLPCGHSFHSPCIAPWLCASSLCPCCRAPFVNALANYASSLPIISSSPDLEAPPDLAAAGGLLHLADHPLDIMTSSNHDTQQQQQHVDLMDIFAEMETALNRFGLLFT